MPTVGDSLKKEITIMLTMLSLGHFITHIVLGAVPVLFPIIREELSLSYTQIGILGTISSVLAGFSNYMTGYISDRKGEEKIIALGLTILGVAAIVTSQIRNFVEFIITRLIEGLGGGFWHPPVSAYVSKKVERRQLGSALSIEGAFGIIGSAVSPLLVVPLAIIYNWRISLLLIGAFSVFISFVIGFVLTREMIKSYTPTENSDFNVHRANNHTEKPRKFSFKLFVIIMIFLIINRTFTFRTITYFTSLFLKDIAGYTPEMAGLLSAVVLGMGGVGALVGGRITDKFGSLRTIIFSTFSASMFFGSIYFLIQIDFLFMLSIVTFLFFIGMPGVESYVMKMSDIKKRGETYGLIFSVGPIVGSFAPVIIGVVADSIGLIYVFAINSLLLLAGVILALFLPRDA